MLTFLHCVLVAIMWIAIITIFFVGDTICYNTFVGCRGVFVGCRGIVSSGRYEQDGSGDEYAPSECIGFFIERKWVDFDDYFAVYGKTISLLEVQGLEVIGNIHDNPERRTKRARADGLRNKNCLITRR